MGPKVKIAQQTDLRTNLLDAEIKKFLNLRVKIYSR